MADIHDIDRAHRRDGANVREALEAVADLAMRADEQEERADLADELLRLYREALALLDVAVHHGEENTKLHAENEALRKELAHDRDRLARAEKAHDDAEEFCTADAAWDLFERELRE